MSETIPDAVPVNVEELARLRKAHDILQALYAYGVEDWKGYKVALRLLEDEIGS